MVYQNAKYILKGILFHFDTCIYTLYDIVSYTNMSDLGKAIQRLRKSAGLTQIEFSKRVGVGLRFVRALEQGKPSVRLDKVNQVLEFLGHHLEVVSDHGDKDVPKS